MLLFWLGQTVRRRSLICCSDLGKHDYVNVPLSDYDTATVQKLAPYSGIPRVGKSERASHYSPTWPITWL